MVATNIAAAPSRPVAALPLFQLFDSLARFGYSDLALFEMSTPGATDALRAWADERGLEIVDKSVSPPGAPAVLMVVVQDVLPNGAHGCRITVSYYSEAS